MDYSDDEEEIRPAGWYKRQGIGRFKRFGCIIIGLLIGMYLLILLLRSALPEGV